jgi:hypothetical protein
VAAAEQSRLDAEARRRAEEEAAERDAEEAMRLRQHQAEQAAAKKNSAAKLAAAEAIASAKAIVSETEEAKRQLQQQRQEQEERDRAERRANKTINPEFLLRQKMRQEGNGAQVLISLIDCDGANAISLDDFNEMALTFNMASMKEALGISARDRAPGVVERVDAVTLLAWVLDDCAGDAELCDRLLMALVSFVTADGARREKRIASVRTSWWHVVSGSGAQRLLSARAVVEPLRMLVGPRAKQR